MSGPWGENEEEYAGGGDMKNRSETDSDLGRRLIDQLTHFVPFGKWFSSSQARNIVVQAFRVHRIPFADITPLPSAPLIFDLEAIRAVFCRGELIYSDPSQWDVFSMPNGSFSVGDPHVVKPSAEGEWVQPDVGEVWKTTKDGMVLLLLTPSMVDEEIRTSSTGTYMSFGEQPAAQMLKVEGVVKDRLLFTRAAIIAVMGRNAAFEELFTAHLRIGGGRARLNSHVNFNFPDTFDKPRVDGVSGALVEEVIERIQSLETDDKNRVSLALRWYLRAQSYRSLKEEEDVDSFVSYWIAFESLAMPNENVNSAIAKLATIHERPSREIKELLPIGRLFGLRGKIVHHGQTPSIGFELLNLMDDLFVDVLLHLLKISAVPKTQAYLDGSANRFIPQTRS